jgi:hypothetical protein
LAVIFTKTRFCVGHGAIGWSNQIEFGFRKVKLLFRTTRS